MLQMSGTESGSLLKNGPRVGEYFSCDIPPPGLELPTSFQLFDISEDNKFLALIDNSFMLQVYELNGFGNQTTVKQQTMADILCEIKCKNSICVYISVASKTGHVVLSFLQMELSGCAFENSSKFYQFTKFKNYRNNSNEEAQEQLYFNEEVQGQQFVNEEEEEMLDKNYATYRIYRETENDILEKSFQGRAVFTKDRLVLIGQWSLDVYDAETLNRMYSLKIGSFYLGNYVDFYINVYYQVQNWCRGYLLLEKHGYSRNSGYRLANMSEHVRKNVIVVYDEDLFKYERNSVKIWSILTGSLICSFVRTGEEYVISVSEDFPFLVANDSQNSALNIYCMKTGTRLCTYKPQGIKNYPVESTIMLVKPIVCQNYILVMGSTVKEEGESDHLFFEIFSIEQQMKVRYVETSTLVSPNSILTLGIFQNEDFLNNPSQLYGVFGETTDNNNRNLKFKTIPLNFYTNDPISNGSFQNRLWNMFTCTCFDTENDMEHTSKFILHDITSTRKTILYLLENDIHEYVLLVSPYAVQLWQLEAAYEKDEPDDGEDEASMATKIFFKNSLYGTEGRLDLLNSTLIYTRSYYELNYQNITCFIFPRLTSQDENQYGRPHVHFLENKGRIFVSVPSDFGNSISEEIILPLPELQTKTTSGLLYGADNSDNITDSVPENDFYDIESCLLGLLHSYRLRHDIISKWSPVSYFSMLSKTKDLLKPMISSSGNAAYFQTRSASKILMGLAHVDEGLGFIMDIVLQKGFHVAVHNFPMVDSENLFAVLIDETKLESENILTVLIKEKKLDFFKLLFNQVVLDYYNGDSVYLFPLTDALLCLEKNELSEQLLECINNLLYLQINLARLHESELQTKGDKNSFKNFTVFRQMKKHNSGTILFYVDKIMCLIRPEKKEIKRVSTYCTENYFMLNQICLIPIPTPRIYDTISYAILGEDSLWRNYIKGPFYILLLIHIVYYIFYTVAISFPEEIFGYNPGSPIQHHGHLVCLIVVLLSWSLFLVEEVKQMIDPKQKYWKSSYNYIDLLALVFPLITFILLITNGPHLYDISSLTTLILWVHFLLRLRVNRRMGILIEIIIQLGIKIAPILGLMILIILAFTHSFAVLLRRQDDGFFQEQFEGKVAPNNENSAESSVVMSDQSQQNLFKDPFLAFTTVWFFLYGIFDPILSGDVGNYLIALVLAILFSFVTALVILNVVIALMTGAIDETEKKGNRNWHIHLADVSNEVESLLGWLIKKEEVPFFIYYHASNKDIELHHKAIEDETKKLRERLVKRMGNSEW